MKSRKGDKTEIYEGYLFHKLCGKDSWVTENQMSVELKESRLRFNG
jgi:hypothetical protein